MLGSWLLYVGVGLVGTGVLGLVATKNGQRWLSKQRRKLFKRAVADSREALRSRSTATPRGKMRAERRAKRKAQPKRLTVGRKRPGDEPTLTQRTAEKVRDRHPLSTAGGWLRHSTIDGIERARVARLNRKATRARKHLTLNQTLTQQAMAPGLCGSTNTDDGKPCQNPCTPGKPHCWITWHSPNWAA